MSLVTKSRIPSGVCNTKVHCLIHKSRHLVPLANLVNLVHTLPFPLLFPLYASVRFPSDRVLTRYLTNIPKKIIFHLLYASFIPSISCTFVFIILMRIRDEYSANYEARNYGHFCVFILLHTIGVGYSLQNLFFTRLHYVIFR